VKIEKKQIDIYKVTEEYVPADCPGGIISHKERTAIIQFEDGFFKKCDFELSTLQHWTYDDWKFLNTVSGKILDIADAQNQIREATKCLQK
jgi:hypothetical protein